MSLLHDPYTLELNPGSPEMADYLATPIQEIATHPLLVLPLRPVTPNYDDHQVFAVLNLQANGLAALREWLQRIQSVRIAEGTALWSSLYSMEMWVQSFDFTIKVDLTESLYLAADDIYLCPVHALTSPVNVVLDFDAATEVYTTEGMYVTGNGKRISTRLETHEIPEHLIQRLIHTLEARHG